jgi:hypothetical protein
VWAVALIAVPAQTCAHHWPGNERAGAAADVEPAGVPVVDRTGEAAVDGSVPVGDGAEDRDEVEGSGWDREVVESDGRDPAGAVGVDTLALATSIAFL